MRYPSSLRRPWPWAGCGCCAAVLTGLAGGRAKISLERVAINVQDARMPDTDGDCPVDLPIRAEGPAAYFATLPLRCIQAGLQDAGIPVEIQSNKLEDDLR